MLIPMSNILLQLGTLENFDEFGTRALEILEQKLKLHDTIQSPRGFECALRNSSASENKDWITYSLALYTCAKAKEMKNRPNKAMEEVVKAR